MKSPWPALGICLLLMAIVLAMVASAGDRPAPAPSPTVIPATPEPSSQSPTPLTATVAATPTATCTQTPVPTLKPTRPPTSTPRAPAPTASPPPPPPVPVANQPTSGASPEASLREQIVARARYYTTQKTHYQHGSCGPTYFDCTGLVYHVFADCFALALIGARGEQGVHNYLDWFTARQQADMEPPQPGDLIVYGPGFAHIGIYVGDGKAISALSGGVREHSATKLRTSASGQLMPVRAYLHLKEQ